jgi:hypothetical protein
MKLDILTAPLTPSEIEWRVQFSKQFSNKVRVVPYITNRCVMDRFDAQFGWDMWENDIQEIQNGFLCRISVFLGEKKVTKTDGASKTDIEAEKGGISDSMKRCAVQYGLGRDLYKYPAIFIENNEQKIPGWAYARLNDLVEYIIKNGTYPQPYVVISQK